MNFTEEYSPCENALFWMPENYTDLSSELPYLHYLFRRTENVAL